jgi:mannose-1-phosphate guanylyltransferase/mannose-6-phosphate isomerase
MGKKIVPLIMCGDAETRLWPASREVRPKQFFAPVRTALDISGHDRAVVGHNAVRAAGRDHQQRLSLQPMRRDSGRADDAVVLALAADHVVRTSGRCRAAS